MLPINSLTFGGYLQGRKLFTNSMVQEWQFLLVISCLLSHLGT